MSRSAGLRPPETGHHPFRAGSAPPPSNDHAPLLVPERPPMKRRAFLPLFASLALLAGCINITINFPSAEIEQAADRIIDQVYGKEAAAPAPPPPSGNTSSTAPGSPPGTAADPLMAWVGFMLEAIVPAARAQAAADLNVSTPAVRALTASMEARHPVLERYYVSGAVGLTEDGLVAVRDLALVALPERNAVRRLVDDENRDREMLYAEIARANGHPEWLDDIRTTFADRWAAKAAPGWWIRRGGAWSRR